MANNRLYLRCRQCGKMIFLSKHFLTPWKIAPDKLEGINEFLSEHCYCPDRKYDVPWNSLDLVSEFGEGFPREEDRVLYHYYDIYHNDYKEEERLQNTYYNAERFSSAIIEMINKGKEENEND